MLWKPPLRKSNPGVVKVIDTSKVTFDLEISKQNSFFHHINHPSKQINRKEMYSYELGILGNFICIFLY